MPRHDGPHAAADQVWLADQVVEAHCIGVLGFDGVVIVVSHEVVLKVTNRLAFDFDDPHPHLPNSVDASAIDKMRFR